MIAYLQFIRNDVLNRVYAFPCPHGRLSVIGFLQILQVLDCRHEAISRFDGSAWNSARSKFPAWT